MRLRLWLLLAASAVSVVVTAIMICPLWLGL
jgi:hypothetical protein